MKQEIVDVITWVFFIYLVSFVGSVGIVCSLVLFGFAVSSLLRLIIGTLGLSGLIFFVFIWRISENRKIVRRGKRRIVEGKQK